MSFNSTGEEYDVVICGGGLAGLTLARQLRREVPGASVIVLDIQAGLSPVAAYKVGEASTELSAYYFCEILGLKKYMETAHLRKMGLRFFFSGGDGEFKDRPEVGSSQFDPVDSFQIDRGIIENDIRHFNRELGVEHLEGCKVDDILLGEGDAPHEIHFTQRSSDEKRMVRGRWVVDAMGRRRFLQKKLGLAGAISKDCSAAWFRMEGHVNICDLVPRTERDWHERVPNDGRYRSTNHLMGDGRWVWMIPLASDCTSIGIVAREDVIPFTEYNTYERALAWLRQNETPLYNLIDNRSPLDFRCMRHYSYTSKQVFSEQRWACTGVAGVFADPLFSFGMDQIGFGNTVITRMIELERAGALTPELVAHYNEVFLSFNVGATWLTQSDMAFFGHPLAVGAKMLWDMIRGWAVTGPQRFDKIYLDVEKAEAVGRASAGLAPLIFRMEKLFKEWAARSPSRASYQFIDYLDIPFVKELYARSLRSGRRLQELVDDHKANMRYLEELAQAIFVIALEDVAPEVAGRLPAKPWLNAWGIGLDERRWEADKLFSPTSEPRDNSRLLEHLRNAFGFSAGAAERTKVSAG